MCVYVYLLLLLFGWTRFRAARFAWWFSPWLVAVLGKTTTRPTITGSARVRRRNTEYFCKYQGQSGWCSIYCRGIIQESGWHFVIDWVSTDRSAKPFQIVKRIFMSFLRAIDEKIRLFCQLFAANTLSKRRKSLSSKSYLPKFRG